MSIVKTGSFSVTAGGAAQNLDLGFVPSKFYMRNDTILVSGTVTGVVEVWYDEYTASLATPYVVINTCTAGVPAISRLASGTLASTTGIIPFQTADFDSLARAANDSSQCLGSSAQGRVCEFAGS